MNDGREKLPWSQDIWDRIDKAVHAECKRTKIAARFLPMYGPIDPNALTVPSDTVVLNDMRPNEAALDVEESATTPIVEIQVTFRLTPQQVREEQGLMTAVTLATRAANLLSQAEDILIFQGDTARTDHSLFGKPDLLAVGRPSTVPRKVQVKSGTAGKGLLNLPDQEERGANIALQEITVPLLPKPKGPPPLIPLRWGENTFGFVSQAYAQLQSGEGLSQAHYGPYALVLYHQPYADTFAPLPTTLIMPADRIRGLITNIDDSKCHFYGTGTLVPDKGILVSIGGNTLDLVMARDARTAFLQEDPDGNYIFRVFERFAVREKDVSCVVRLNFEPLPPP